MAKKFKQQSLNQDLNLNTTCKELSEDAIFKLQLSSGRGRRSHKCSLSQSQEGLRMSKKKVVDYDRIQKLHMDVLKK